MKRILIAALALATLALAGTALAGSTHGALIKLRPTKAGTLLVNRRGFTLYVFARDHRNHDACVHIAGCTTVWPPVLTSGGPVAGNGIMSSLLGSTALPGGRKQVTYAGHPLYRYIGDPAAGDTRGIGLRNAGGKWWAIGVAGHLITKS